MRKYETHFIPENVAPVGATEILVLGTDGDEKPTGTVGRIPLGNLDSGVKKSDQDFAVCVLSDVHVFESGYPTSTEDLKRALTYANTHCAFTCIAGDLVNTGGQYVQLENYANLVAQYSPDKPVYAIAGNHENYDGYSDGTRGFTLSDYTGYPLYYSFGVDSKGQRVAMDTAGTPREYDDSVSAVFVMVGHWGSYRGDGIGWIAGEFVTVEELQWLYETLEANRNKRCLVFTHVLPIAHGVGDPCDLYGNHSAGTARLWNVTDGGVGQAFINLLTHYKNTLLLHGHSHTRFSLQELDPMANYAEVRLADGRSYKSVHIPSLAIPRDSSGGTLQNETAESEGYIMEVYPDCIILNGRDFVDNESDGHWLPIATYRIDTTLRTVEAGTFTDDTGILHV